MGWFPRINSRGQVARGRGVITVEGVEIGEGLNPQWLTDGALLVIRFDDKLYPMSPATGVVGAPLASDVSSFSAGGGQWQRTIASVIQVATSREGLHVRIEESGGDNNDRSLFVPGMIAPLVAHQPISNPRIEADHVVWSLHSGQIWGCGVDRIAERLQLSNTMELLGVPIPTPDGMWILTMTHTELRLAPWGSDEGYILALGNDQNLNPDAVFIDGKIRVAWNTSTGQPGQIDVDLGAQRVKLLESAPPQPHPPEIDAAMIKSFEHPFFLTPFYSHGKYGNTTDHVGNSILLVGTKDEILEDMTEVAPLHLPLIVGATDLSPEQVNSVVAWWESGLSIDEIGDKVWNALNLSVTLPVVAYLDKGDAEAWPASRPSWMNQHRVWPSVQAYRNEGEALQTFFERVEFAIKRVKSYGTLGWTLTPAFYTRNKNPDGTPVVPVAEILECMPLYERWIREYQPNVVMPFCDMRPSGMNDHPELREWCRRFQYAVPMTRPNRFDYWKPEEQDVEEVLKNKLGQSRAAVVLEPYLRELILELVEGEQPDPEPEPGPPDGEHEATMELAMLQLMKDQHPQINSCDEDSLETGRALLVDWTAQRLNKRDGKVVWGRKSRGKPENGIAVNPNTDGLTYLREDGRFEIIDAFSGSPDDSGTCPPTWENHGAFDQGANGWWAPPQLPKETCH